MVRVNEPDPTATSNQFVLKSKLYVIFKFYFKTTAATLIAWFTLDFITYSLK